MISLFITFPIILYLSFLLSIIYSNIYHFIYKDFGISPFPGYSVSSQFTDSYFLLFLMDTNSRTLSMVSLIFSCHPTCWRKNDFHKSHFHPIIALYSNIQISVTENHTPAPVPMEFTSWVEAILSPTQTNHSYVPGIYSYSFNRSFYLQNVQLNNLSKCLLQNTKSLSCKYFTFQDF